MSIEIQEPVAEHPPIEVEPGPERHVSAPHGLTPAQLDAAARVVRAHADRLVRRLRHERPEAGSSMRERHG